MNQIFSRHLLVIVSLVGICAGYSFFPWISFRDELTRFNSPDEAANYFFAQKLSHAEPLALSDPLNGLAQNLVHPRSTQVVNGSIVPGSFLGLPVLYGVVGLAFGTWLLPLLTPLVALVLAVAGYAIWRRYVSTETALAGAALAALHPALWYYTARGFYHNVLFVALLSCAALAYCRLREERYRLTWLVVSLGLVAVALFVRTIEVVWVAPLVLAAAWANRQEWKFRHFVAAGLTLGFVLIGWLYLSVLTHGQLVPPGYTLGPIVGGFHPRVWWQALVNTLLPFGFHPVVIVRNVWYYGVALFWPYWVLVGWGALTWRGRALSRSYRYAAMWVTVWLLAYYGNWQMTDTLGPSRLTIGTSYVRYWLPVYLVWLPLAGASLLALRDQFPQPTRRVVLAAILLGFSYASFSQVFFDRTEGLVVVAERLSEYRATGRDLERLTSADALIIGDRTDKVAFPERRVIVSDGRPVLDLPAIRAVLPALVAYVPVYYQTVVPPGKELVASLTRERFKLVSPTALPDRSWLYRLIQL